jgi:hypothetical protein
VSFDWDPVLALGSWVVAQPRDVPPEPVHDFYEDADWSGARTSLLRLLDYGLDTPEAGLPLARRADVWHVVDACLHDPEPLAVEEVEQKEGLDYATLSINRLRAIALHSAVRYGVWVVRAHGDGPFDTGITDYAPELRDALDRHLDPTVERAPSVRAVYGWRFGLLWHLDRHWAELARPRVFPTAEADASLRAATWQTMMIWGRQQPLEFAKLLHSEYAIAIATLPGQDPGRSPREDPRKGLVHHLLDFYVLGAIELVSADGLLAGLLRRAPDELRAHAIHRLGQGLSHEDECPAAVRDRAMAFWAARMEAARSAPTSSKQELGAFGSWLGAACLPAKWRAAQALAVIRLVGRLDPPWGVVEDIGAVFPEAPLEVLDCLRALVEGTEGSWDLAGWEEHGVSILRQALAHEDADVRSRAEAAINRFLAMGYTKLRSLLESLPPPASGAK